MARQTDTRFIVITHNPITMARMDRLFGVTMAERGVSQLVSVDLEAAERIPGGVVGRMANGRDGRFASPRLRGEGCRRQQACAAGEGEGAATKEAPRLGRRLFRTAPSPPLRSRSCGRRPTLSRKRGEAKPRLSPGCAHPLSPQAGRGDRRPSIPS